MSGLAKEKSWFSQRSVTEFAERSRDPGIWLEQDASQDNAGHTEVDD